MKVKCINIREAFPEQIIRDSFYYIDIPNMFDDYGDWYVHTYHNKELTKSIGNLKLSHFTRVE